jgi:hypothetical protein
MEGLPMMRLFCMQANEYLFDNKTNEHTSVSSLRALSQCECYGYSAVQISQVFSSGRHLLDILPADI